LGGLGAGGKQIIMGSAGCFISAALRFSAPRPARVVLINAAALISRCEAAFCVYEQRRMHLITFIGTFTPGSLV